MFPDEVLLTEKVVALRKAASGVYLGPDFSGSSSIFFGVGRSFYYGKRVQKAIDDNVFMRIEEVPNIDLNIKKLMLGRIYIFWETITRSLNI